MRFLELLGFRKVLHLDVWHPVWSDDTYDEVIDEPVFSDDLESKNVDDWGFIPYEDCVVVWENDREIYRGTWIGELEPHPEDTEGQVFVGVQDQSPYCCVLQAISNSFWLGDRLVQVERTN